MILSVRSLALWYLCRAEFCRYLGARELTLAVRLVDCLAWLGSVFDGLLSWLVEHCEVVVVLTTVCAWMLSGVESGAAIGCYDAKTVSHRGQSWTRGHSRLTEAV